MIVRKAYESELNDIMKMYKSCVKGMIRNGIDQWDSSYPNSKIIACLRNPVDRAYSNYIIEFQDGDTELSFEERIQPEIELINDKKIKLEDETFLVVTYYNKILTSGFYADQLRYWYEIFPKNQLLMVSSEDLANNTNNTLDITPPEFKYNALHTDLLLNFSYFKICLFLSAGH